VPTAEAGHVGKTQGSGKRRRVGSDAHAAAAAAAPAAGAVDGG